MPFICHYMEEDGSLAPPAGRARDSVNHMSTARKRAETLAFITNKRVQISRVLPENKMVPSLIINPDGSAARPLHSQPVSRIEDCTKGTGRACFCSPCRAERRGK